jgi:hypothetical protein
MLWGRREVGQIDGKRGMRRSRAMNEKKTNNIVTMRDLKDYRKAFSAMNNKSDTFCCLPSSRSGLPFSINFS